MNNKKWRESAELFKSAIKRWQKEPQDAVLFAALCKTFEISFEYTWKAFKAEADLAGYEVYNPRDALKAAAQMKLILDLELWTRFLNVRNLSVHDYLGAIEDDMRTTALEFERELDRLITVL